MSSLRVMVVEDESIVALEIEDRLRRLGYTVCAVIPSGEKAIEIARETQPDLILMDIYLAGKIDGIEAAEAIKRHKDIPIIFLTAYSDPSTVERAKQIGPFAYLVKPFDENQLRTSIEIALYKHEINKRLEEKERWLNSVLSSIGDGVIATDASGKVAFMNPVACQLTGWTSNEAIGEPIENVFRINIKERQMPHGIAGTEMHMGWLHRSSHSILESREGRVIHVDWRITPIMQPDAKVAGNVLVFRDISERVRAENEIKQARDHARRLLDITPVIIFATDSSNRISLVNRCCREVLGYQDQELVGCDWIDKLVVEDKRDNARQFISSSSWSSGLIRCYECQVTTKQGEIREVLFHITPISDTKPGGYLLAGEDLTEFRRAERERLELESRLHHAQKMEAVGTLASGVAHEFNNLITAIRGNAELALMRVDPASPIHYDLEEIKKAADNASALTRQLLAFSRRGRKQEKVDLNKCVSNMISMLERLLGGIKIECHLQQNLPPIVGSAGEIEQIVMNLVLNARDAMPKGGRVTIRTEWEVASSQEFSGDDQPEKSMAIEEFVNLVVEDTGVGMDESVRCRVFEPFFTTKEPGKGTGLGLSVVYGIVKRYGGDIDIESQLGKGTRVTVKFPVAKLPESKPEDLKSWEAKLGKGEKILVVEDDPDVLEFLRKLLSGKGYQVKTAQSLRQATEHLEDDSEIKVVFSDVVLSDGDAFNLVEKIRQSFPSIGVILASGYFDSRGGCDRALSQGIPFIYKPYSLPELLSLIRKMIDGEKDRADLESYSSQLSGSSKA